LGQRSRKRRSTATQGASNMARGYARGELRNEAVRAELEPLAPGERPRALTVAAVVAAALAIANLTLLFTGYEVRGQQPKAAGVIVFTGLMTAAAIGMWRKQYWAVLGFQALLGISVVIASLSLLVARNVQGALLSTVFALLAGTLFWFLIRAMARIQTPQRPTRA
jgi:hypothetical protein